MNTTTKYWLAGLLEGEGYFFPEKEVENRTNPLGITLQMTDEDIVSRVADLFGVKYHLIKARKDNWKDSYQCCKRGAGALKIMKELKPLMGERRQNQIQEAINSHTLRKGKISKEDKEDIIKLKDTMKPIEIAEKYPISKWRVYQILRGE